MGALATTLQGVMITALACTNAVSSAVNNARSKAVCRPTWDSTTALWVAIDEDEPRGRFIGEEPRDTSKRSPGPCLRRLKRLPRQ